MSRYFASMCRSLKDGPKVLDDPRRSEAMIYGMILFYCYREKDAGFATTQREVLAKVLVETGTEVRATTRLLVHELTQNPRLSIVEARVRGYGFDQATARLIAVDVLYDGLASFRKWLTSDPQYRGQGGAPDGDKPSK